MRDENTPNERREYPKRETRILQTRTENTPNERQEYPKRETRISQMRYESTQENYHLNDKLQDSSLAGERSSQLKIPQKGKRC